MCRASARARMVRCRSSSITLAMVLMLVAITSVCGAPPPQFEFCCLSSIYKDFMPPPNSANVFFPNASFNNVVVSLGVFFKRTQNLIAQHCSADTYMFPKYSVTHCLAIHECSVSYARFFFFLHVDCCTHLLLHSCAFYRPRKSFFPLSTCTIICHKGTLTYFQVTSYISLLVWHMTVSMRLLES